jgi:hypothetical protein
VVTRNEARKMLGLQEAPDSDIFIEELATPALPDVTIEQPQRALPAPEKGLKAAPKLETIEQQVERVAAELLKSHFKQAAEAVTGG